MCISVLKEVLKDSSALCPVAGRGDDKQVLSLKDFDAGALLGCDLIKFNHRLRRVSARMAGLPGKPRAPMA